MRNMIKLTKPYISKEEYRNVKKVLKSGNLTEGIYARELEKYISDYIGASKTFVTSSATTGMQLALTALGIGYSDEVIIPDFSFPATANRKVANCIPSSRKLCFWISCQISDKIALV